MKSASAVRVTITAAVAAVMLPLAATGCSGPSDEKTHIRVLTQGSMGLEAAGLYAEYEKLHPDVKIDVKNIDGADKLWASLQPKLGSGGKDLGDIVAVEVGFVRSIVENNADLFSDLSKAPGAEPGSYYPWKSAQATTKDGKLIGLGTDIGPMGICYRKDLFEQAGLPTDPKAVGELWAGSWEKYVDTGAAFQKKVGDKGQRFMDTSQGLYNAVISGQATSYYDAGGKLIYDTNPEVKRAYDLSARAATSQMTSGQQQWSEGWKKSFADGRIATVACPSWMLGIIKENSGASYKGKWDVAKAPLPANWGGSFLAVPNSSKVKDEAQKLAAWLTAPAQQVKLHRSQGHFPSTNDAATRDAVAGTRNEYFDNASTGKIFTEVAETVPTLAVGPKGNEITGAIGKALDRVVGQGEAPDKAWNKAMDDLKSVTGKG
ncbi:extracellular solute-binding protein [Streptomyces sp. ISL-44]|uniref:ABC transporter substrate-binding protein n=1 Tax=Streptomyces sp. ISL-44 TaxID=2819184 RepID=UPI001BE92067|nr:extracellular solute-binding protein [Streptomyces sp. ISL-44]MBT2541553.1 extracellular solute-binding protein [Streptomyces sp. ISL-44]